MCSVVPPVFVRPVPSAATSRPGDSQPYDGASRRHQHPRAQNGQNRGPRFAVGNRTAYSVQHAEAELGLPWAALLDIDHGAPILCVLEGR